MELRGRILKRGDRTPVADVDVVLDDGQQEARTDDDGRFVFPSVPSGKHRVRLRSPEIAPGDVEEVLRPNTRLSVTYYVEVKRRYTTTVRGRPVLREPVEQRLSASEFQRIPGTQGDTLKAVQNLPGVARAPFGAGQLIVWGSRPQDTRAYVDGVAVPTLYHFGGLRSTVNGEFISSLAFLPGAYRADYGRGLGGVVELETRRPRDRGIHGYAQVDLIDGSFAFEAAINKKLSIAVGARRSWIDAILPVFTSNDFQLAPRYWDYQARLRYQATPRDELDVFFFGSDDTIRLITRNPDPALSAQFDSHTYYHRALVRWQRRFAGRASLSVVTSAGYDVPFQIRASVGNFPLAVDARTASYTLRALLRAPLTSFLRLDAGLDFEGARWDIQATSPQSGFPREGDPNGPPLTVAIASEQGRLYRHDLAPFVALQFSFADGQVVLTPAVRLDLYTLRAQSSYAFGTVTGRGGIDAVYPRIEPRLNLRWQALPKLDVKAALGVYHQAADPASLSVAFGNPRLRPEFSIHYVAGIEARPRPGLTLTVEGFYKDLANLIVRSSASGEPPLRNGGEGRIYGGQLLLRQEIFKGFFGWITYTLSRSERRDRPGEPYRVFQFDQTHIFTLIASYQFGRGYQVGVRFRYVTGNPLTPVVGAYYDANQGNYTPIYGPIYSDRLPAFHQLDLRFDKTWTFKKWRFSTYLDIQNIYNRANPEGLTYNFDFTETRRISGIPIFPVIGLRGDL